MLKCGDFFRKLGGYKVELGYFRVHLFKFLFYFGFNKFLQVSLKFCPCIFRVLNWLL